MRSHANDLRAEIEKQGELESVEADLLVHQLASQWRDAPLSDADHELCLFAEKLTKSPAAMTEENIATLRSHGFCDAAIHDATQVISYFNYINRIADALNVDQEETTHAWERSVP